MPGKKIRDLLEKKRIAYEVLPHAVAYTALETAEAAHVPGPEFAKVTILLVDGRPVMAVLPAPLRVDLARLQELIGAREISLAHERTVESLFFDCEAGAEPPFGRLYGLDVYADALLSTHPTIAFNAGTHQEAMRMAFSDWRRLARPVMGAFAVASSREPRNETGAWGG